MFRRSPFAVLAAAVFLSATPAATFAQGAAPPNPRIALVIGESTYGDQTLATPVNDAALIAQTLQAAGFDVVGARDLDEKSLRGAMRDFLDKAAAIGPDMQAFVYLAGRGVQYEGDNFFLPVDAQLARDSDTPMAAVRIADFAHALASEPGRARIVVLDAARASPAPGQGQPLAGGLALVDPDQGELVAFNAAPGAIGGDEQGPYGVYAKTLAGAMREGGLAIEDVLAQTRVQVNQATGGAQIPWSASKLTAPYYVFERAADAPPPPAAAAYADAASKPIRAFPADQAYSIALGRDTLPAYADFLAAYPNAPEARRVRAILAARREALFWRRAVAQDAPQAYWTYLRRYPRGPHVADAGRRLAILAAAMQPPSGFAPEDYSDLPPPPQEEYVYADRPVYVFVGPDYGPPPPPPPPGYYASEDDDWRRLPPPAPPVAAGVLPALAVAIPLLIGARAYRDAGRHEGRAPVGAPPPRPPQAQNSPPPPPPLPGGLKLRPVPPSPGPTPAPSASPAPGKPLDQPPGKTPTGAPTATPTPTNGLKPLPSLTPTPNPSPGPTTPKPGEGAAGGGKPLPTVTPEKDLRGPTPGPSPTKGVEPKPTSSEGAAGGGKPLPSLTPEKDLRGPKPGPSPTKNVEPTTTPTLSEGAAGGGKPLPSLTPEKDLRGPKPGPSPIKSVEPPPTPTSTRDKGLAPKPAPNDGAAGGGKPSPTLTPEKDLRGPTPAPTRDKGFAPGPKPTTLDEGATGGKPSSEAKPLKEMRSPGPGPGPKEGGTSTPESKPAPTHLAPPPDAPGAKAGTPPGKPERQACGKPGLPPCPK
jgi:uncharacterized caspase-like protein